MDAGTAAVLGALAGSGATIGAALATGWAQREGARITARAEHRRERRAPRHDIYKKLITDLEGIRRRTAFYVAMGETLTPDDISERDEEFLIHAGLRVKTTATDVALAGPRTVTEIALVLTQGIDALVGGAASFRVLSASHHEQIFRDKRLSLLSTAERFEKACDELVLRAQFALDDDGSRRS